MSKISVYDIVPVPKLADKLIGTSVGGDIEDITYNFTLGELLNLFIPNIPANNLQGVLNFGNTATQDINLTGIINTTNLNVGNTATILNSNFTGETRITGGLFDRVDSRGTAGQVLISTGTQVEWYTIPTVIPTLQQVLTEGNTADKNIILTANIEAVTATFNNVVSNTSLSVLGTLKDKDASVGVSGQILSSTGTNVQWINAPIYTSTLPIIIDSGTKVISIQQANNTQNGYLSSTDWINFDGKQNALPSQAGQNGKYLTTDGTILSWGESTDITLSPIGNSPNANGATLTGSLLNLQPASATFGGVVTTGSQIFAGAKEFSTTSSSGRPYSFINNQSGPNSSDTGDGVLAVNYNLAGSTGIQVVIRGMSFSTNNNMTGGTVQNLRGWNVASSTASGSTTTNLDQIYIERGGVS